MTTECVMTIGHCPCPWSWAARYNTGFLGKLTTKGVGFFPSFPTVLSQCLLYEAKSCGVGYHDVFACKYQLIVWTHTSHAKNLVLGNVGPYMWFWKRVF